MTRAEWISLIAYAFFFIASWFHRLSVQRRITIAATGAFGTLLIAAAQFGAKVLQPSTASFARDLLPTLLMPLVYWQAGQFSTQINKSFQANLQSLDRQLLGSWVGMLKRPGLRWI